MNLYKIDNYDIMISPFKNKFDILVKDINNNKYILRIDEHMDSVSNTSCDNNITLSLNSSIYNFIINCLEKKPFYSMSVTSEKYFDDNVILTLNFIFKYGDFDFSYIISLDTLY